MPNVFNGNQQKSNQQYVLLALFDRKLKQI